MIVSSTGAKETPFELAQSEQQMLEALDARTIVWCGSGSTALCLAYRIAVLAGEKCQRPEIILPATGCGNIVSTVIACGFVPRFADVDPLTGMPTLSQIAAVHGPNTRAVVFIHLFGNTIELADLRKWARDHRVILIEDIAQALGGLLPSGAPAGSVGDMAVCSFSRAKVIDCGGGALIIRSGTCEQFVRETVDHLPLGTGSHTNLVSDLEARHPNLQRRLITQFRDGSDIDSAAIADLCGRSFDSLWIQPFCTASILNERLNMLGSALAVRAQKARTYLAALKEGPWRILDAWTSSGACWRFSVLLDHAASQVPLSEALRKKGFHVSNLYWPLTDLFGSSDNAVGANTFGRRIVNLFVDPCVDAGEVKACGEYMRRLVADTGEMNGR